MEFSYLQFLLWSVEREIAHGMFTVQAVIGEDLLGGFPRFATGSGMIVTEKACDLPARANMVPHLLFHVFCPPPTTSQSVFPVADQRFSVRGVCCLRRVCGLNRRTPLLGERERILPQSGHSTRLMEL